MRTVALVILTVGAFVAEALMLVAGRQNTHYVLTALFLIWVASPFALLLVADRVSTRWPVQVRTTLYWLVLVVTFATVATYANRILRPPKAQPAAVFVAVPPASWLLIGLVLGGAFVVARRSRT